MTAPQTYNISFTYRARQFEADVVVSHYLSVPPSYSPHAASDLDFYGYDEVDFAITKLSTIVEDELLEWTAPQDSVDAAYQSQLWLAGGDRGWVGGLYKKVEATLLETIAYSSKGECDDRQ